MKKALTREDLEGFGSLLTLKGEQTCLGDLWHVDSIPDEKGVEHKDVTFDPTHGRVPVSKEESQAHNAALDSAKVEGLDNQCKVGEGGNFYITRLDGHWKITTFVGTVIADEKDIDIMGLAVTVRRKGRVFCGRRNTSDDCIFLKRTK